MVRWVDLHAVPYIRKSLRLENTPGSLQSGMPGSNYETHGTFCNGLGSNIMVQYYVGPIITLHGPITAREYMDRLGSQVHPMIQTFPSEQWCSFPRQQCPHSHSWNCSVIVRRAWRRTSTSSLASTIIRAEHWSTLIHSGRFWRQVSNRFPPPTSLKQLEDIPQEEWYKIPLHTVQNLYESIPRRTVALLKAKVV
jgi:hypothetical protein